MSAAAGKKKAKNNFRLSVVTKTTKGALNQLTGAYRLGHLVCERRNGDLGAGGAAQMLIGT